MIVVEVTCQLWSRLLNSVRSAGHLDVQTEEQRRHRVRKFKLRRRSFQLVKCPFTLDWSEVDMASAKGIFLDFLDFCYGFLEGLDVFLPVLVQFHLWRYSLLCNCHLLVGVCDEEVKGGEVGLRTASWSAGQRSVSRDKPLPITFMMFSISISTQIYFSGRVLFRKA